MLHSADVTTTETTQTPQRGAVRHKTLRLPNGKLIRVAVVPGPKKG